MRKSWIRLVAGYALTAGAFGAAAGADMILTLEPKDMNLNPISGGVPPGTRILVDVLISVDAEDDTGLVITSFDLTFDASSETIVVDSFSFLADMSAYAFQLSNVDAIGAFSFQCAAANCIELTQQPSPLGRAVVIVNGAGVLNAAGFIGIGGGRQTVFEAIDTTGATASVTFWLSGDNLQGGTLDLSVTDGTTPPPTGPAPGGGSIPDVLDPDDDGDGAPGVEDVFPLDPDETIDSVGDGVGDVDDDAPLDPTVTVMDPAETDDNADDPDADDFSISISGRLPCGIAMVQTSIFILLGLSGMGRARRRTNRCSAA